jgi:ACS family D-galactonate transporter-like MFS transporter
MTDTAATTSLSATARWRIVVLIMVYTALGHYNREGMSVAGTEIFIDQYGISDKKMGQVYSAFLFAYMIGMLPCGWLIDRIGSGRTLELFGISVGIFVVLTGMLGWVTTTPASLLVGLLIVRTLAGACFAPLHPGRAHLVSHSISKRGQATANGMATAGALIGIAVSYPIFGGLIDRFGWQGAFVFNGLTLIAFACVWRLYARPLLPDPKVRTAAESSTDWTSALSLLRHKNLWLLTLSYAAYGYFQYLFFYWVEHYLDHVLHMPKLESRQASCYIMLTQGAGMAIGGLTTDWICRRLGTSVGRRSIVLTGMGLAGLFAFMSVNSSNQGNAIKSVNSSNQGGALLSVSSSDQGNAIKSENSSDHDNSITSATSSSHATTILLLALSMGALGICEGVFWTTATDIGGNSRGFSGAFMNTGGNMGGLISPSLNPILAEYVGWSGAITVACVIAALGGTVWFWIRLECDEDSNRPAPVPGPDLTLDRTVRGVARGL